MKKEEKTIEKKIGITFSTAFTLRRLLGKFAIVTYDDVEVIKAKATQLDEVAKQFFQLHDGNQEKANQVFNDESTVTKTDLAYLTKDEFKQVICQRGFEFDHVELLEYWFVK